MRPGSYRILLSLTMLFLLLLFADLSASAEPVPTSTPLPVMTQHVIDQPAPRLFIVSIGIQEYRSSEYNLKYTRADAEEIGRELERRGGNAIYSAVRTPTILIDEHATRAGILSTLDRLQGEIASTDTLIIFFAGRGEIYAKAAAHRGGIDPEPTENSKFYLFPSDVDPKNIGVTSISGELIQVYLQRIRAKNKLFIFDSCNSAYGHDTVAKAFTNQDQELAAENSLFIGVDTLSFDDDERQHGALTSVVLDGIGGNADFDGNGAVTARELEAYAYSGALPFSIKYERSGGFHPRTIFTGKDFAIALTDKEMSAAKYSSMDLAALTELSKSLKPSRAEIVGKLPHDEALRDLERSKTPLLLEKTQIETMLAVFGSTVYLNDPPERTALRKQLKTNKDQLAQIDGEIAKLRATIEAKKHELERLNAELKLVEDAIAAKQAKPEASELTRANVVSATPKKPEDAPRQGQDYALLFANDDYGTNWSPLKNPYNDATEIAAELEKTYGFKKENVAVLRNLTKAQMEEVIENYHGSTDADDKRSPRVYYSESQTYDSKNYRDVTFKPDDQLFVFFAGHGQAFEVGKDGANRPIVDGLLVAADSPKFTRSARDKFLSLDTLLKSVDTIPNDHIMVVFDACFAGQIWSPATMKPLEETSRNKLMKDDDVAAAFAPLALGSGHGPNQYSFASVESTDPQMSRERYIRQRMGHRSRVMYTSGGEAVPDGYCEEKVDGVCRKYSDHSPFAAKFIEALRKNGNHFNVLTGYEMIPFFTTLDTQKVVKGKLDDLSDGDFVFIAPEKK